MISAIVVNYHSARLTERAVKSLLSERVDLEIFIVDNGSTPEEKELLAGMAERYQLTLIVNDENTGFASANNKAFSVSKGEYVFLLNPDAYVVYPCLDILKGFLEVNPGAGAVSPMVYWDDDKSFLFPLYPYPSPFNDLVLRLLRLSKKLGYLYSLYERRQNLKLWRSPSALKVKNLHAGCVLLRRSSIEKAGGLFDERFFMYFEDTDLFLRLKRAGCGLFIETGAKAVHNYCHKQDKLNRMSEMLELYCQKHYGRSFLMKISRALPQPAPAELINFGTWETPPSFSVPENLTDGYLFEWSPDPLFRPSLGCFGSGRTFYLPNQIWSFLQPGDYYSRITDPEKFFCKTGTLAWRKSI